MATNKQWAQGYSNGQVVVTQALTAIMRTDLTKKFLCSAIAYACMQLLPVAQLGVHCVHLHIQPPHVHMTTSCTHLFFLFTVPAPGIVSQHFISCS